MPDATAAASLAEKRLLKCSSTPSAGSRPSLDFELPQIIRTRNGRNIIRPCQEFVSFMYHELDVSRLDTIEPQLWLARQPDNVRPLHRQQLLDRKIVLCEQADLYLTWKDDTIFVKPLPAWLVDCSFFEEHLCTSRSLPAALGFLRSYIFLLSYESDFRLAADLGLVPPGLNWKGWLAIVQDLIPQDLIPQVFDNDRMVSPRYRYGELRLNRINLIYRFHPRFRLQHFCRGYHYSYRTYQSFINQNFDWLPVVFVYFTILLTAM